MADLITLIYSSTAKYPMSDDELAALLTHARAKNQQLDLTGILLYRDGSFLQVLEGEAATVERLYETIKRDSRHEAVHLLLKRPIRARTFGDWRMGFLNASGAAAENLPGFTPFLREPLNERAFAEDQFVLAFLRAFRDALG
jgi:hypothetical protein